MRIPFFEMQKIWMMHGGIAEEFWKMELREFHSWISGQLIIGSPFLSEDLSALMERYPDAV